jgi:hypothetical protein
MQRKGWLVSMSPVHNVDKWKPKRPLKGKGSGKYQTCPEHQDPIHYADDEEDSLFISKVDNDTDWSGEVGFFNEHLSVNYISFLRMMMMILNRHLWISCPGTWTMLKSHCPRWGWQVCQCCVTLVSIPSNSSPANFSCMFDQQPKCRWKEPQPRRSKWSAARVYQGVNQVGCSTGFQQHSFLLAMNTVWLGSYHYWL